MTVIQDFAGSKRPPLHGRCPVATPRWRAVLLCDREVDVANAEQLADDLRSQLRLANDTRVHAVSVVAMAPRAKRDDWLPGLRSQGTIVATPASAEYLNLNDFGLVGILTALPDRLATRLAFPPARRQGGRRLRVLDYVGTLAGTVARDWVEIAHPSEPR